MLNETYTVISTIDTDTLLAELSYRTESPRKYNILEGKFNSFDDYNGDKWIVKLERKTRKRLEMKVICNEYTIGDEKLVIEHDIAKDDFYFRVINLKTLEVRHESEAIGALIAARAKGFQFMGVKF